MKRFAAVAIAAAGLAFSADETVFYIGHHEKFVNITFDSQADIETIVGTTNKATGTVKADLEKGVGSVSLSVPVASLKTGIELRDEHLRSENWLDEKKFPQITFVSKKAEPVKDAKNKVKVTGDFTMHGVTKEMTVVVDWKELPAEAVKKSGFPEGQWLKFSTEFPVKITDFGVKIPDGVGPKVSETWNVKMTMFAGTKKPEEKK
jgi:polyisoprenoid-binding protein YceI